MSHSNSSLNTYLACQKKYDLCYNQNIKPPTDDTHLRFGSMGHKVLEEAGNLRDTQTIVMPGDYTTVIPSEVQETDLKEYFGIRSWQSYFTNVIRQCATYEEQLIKTVGDGQIEVHREVKLQYSPQELAKCGVMATMPLVGVIDLLLLNTELKRAVIVDYKFSTTVKNQDDFENNSQLYLYAELVHQTYKIPMRNIIIAYIDIVKQDFTTPTLLSNGTLSRDKSQNVSQDIYKKAVEAIHGANDLRYNCNPGGWYYDCYCNLANKKIAYLNYQYVDEDAQRNVVLDLLNCIAEIEYKNMAKQPFLRKHDSYSCAKCDYKKWCKPWLSDVWPDN